MVEFTEFGAATLGAATLGFTTLGVVCGATLGLAIPGAKEVEVPAVTALDRAELGTAALGVTAPAATLEDDAGDAETLAEAALFAATVSMIGSGGCFCRMTARRSRRYA
jgi:hypothetical protein